jgi:hypothetical protein
MPENRTQFFPIGLAFFHNGLHAAGICRTIPPAGAPLPGYDGQINN